MLISKELYNSLLEFCNGHWITVHPHGKDEKGQHLFVEDNESPFDAMQRQWGVSSKGQLKLDFKGAKKKAKEESKKEDNKQSFEHNGAKVDVLKDGKCADVKIYAPKGKKFKNGDEWYKTQMPVDEIEARSKAIIDNEFGEKKKKEEPKKEEGTKENNHITKDNYGRTIVNKPNSNKKVIISRNGDYYLASYGQELKEPDGYTEFQVFPSASGKSFKTEKGAIRWAEKILEKQNSLTYDDLTSTMF